MSSFGYQLVKAFLSSTIDGADKGIIPLTCSELFVRVQDKVAVDPNLSFTVEVSYIEVYCNLIDTSVFF